MVDGGVAGLHPADLAPLMHLQRQAKALRSEPQPHPPRRTGLGESREDRGDRRAHGFIGVEADFAVGFAPDKADRQTAPKLTTRRLVADAAVEPGAQDVELRLAHCAFQPEQEPVVEQRRVIDPVRIADQGVGEAAQVDEPIPVGIVAGQSGHLQAQDQTDVSKGDLGGQPGKARSRDCAGAGQTEVLVDDDNPIGRPAKLTGLMRQGVLSIGRLAVVLDLGGA